LPEEGKRIVPPEGGEKSICPDKKGGVNRVCLEKKESRGQAEHERGKLSIWEKRDKIEQLIGRKKKKKRGGFGHGGGHRRPMESNE